MQLKLFILILIVIEVSWAKADINAPFATVNRNPFIQIFGLPAPHGTELNASSAFGISWQSEVVSNFSFDNMERKDQQQESIVIDGETHGSSLRVSYGYSDNIELGVSIAHLNHRGGSLDNFIDDWHDYFGLPDGDRADFPQDQLTYRYDSGDELYTLNKPDSGFGDITLDAGVLLSVTDVRKLVLRGGIKLPVGDSRSLFGSGSTDTFISLNVSDVKKSGYRWHMSGGLLWMDRSELLSERHNHWVAFSSSTISWPVNELISLKAQLDMHSAFYDSKTSELGNPSAQLIMGGAIRVNKNWVLDLSVSEDIAVDTAPDVVFHLGLTYMRNE